MKWYRRGVMKFLNRRRRSRQAALVSLDGVAELFELGDEESAAPVGLVTHRHRCHLEVTELIRSATSSSSNLPNVRQLLPSRVPRRRLFGTNAELLRPAGCRQ